MLRSEFRVIKISVLVAIVANANRAAVLGAFTITISGQTHGHFPNIQPPLEDSITSSVAISSVVILTFVSTLKAHYGTEYYEYIPKRERR